MGGRARRGVGLAAVGGVAIAGVMAVTSMSVSGVEPTQTDDPYFEPFGTLTVALGDRMGEVTLFDAQGSLLASQAIETQQPCAKIAFGPVVLPGDASATGNLLNFTAKVGGATGAGFTVQLPDDRVGVSSSSTSCGNPDAVFGPGEELELELGSFFDQDPASPVLIESGSLEIAKTNPQDSDLAVRFIGGDYAASSVVSEFPVASNGETILLDNDNPILNDPADPDDGLGVFEGVALSSTATKDNRGLSLAGPGDPVTATTRLNLVTAGEFDFAVDCGEFVSVTGEYAVAAEFLRAQNGIDLDGNNVIDEGEAKFGACVDVGVVVHIEEDRVFWDNSATGVDGSPQDVSGIVTIDFVVDRSDPGFDPGVLEREIDFDADGPAFGFIPVSELWCETYSRTDASGGPILNVVFPQITDPNDPAATVPAPWCLVDDTRRLDGTQISQTLQVVGNGDPWIR